MKDFYQRWHKDYEQNQQVRVTLLGSWMVELLSLQYAFMVETSMSHILRRFVWLGYRNASATWSDPTFTSICEQLDETLFNSRPIKETSRQMNALITICCDTVHS